jgi:hypothetical protein
MLAPRRVLDSRTERSHREESKAEKDAPGHSVRLDPRDASRAVEVRSALDVATYVVPSVRREHDQDDHDRDEDADCDENVGTPTHIQILPHLKRPFG